MLGDRRDHLPSAAQPRREIDQIIGPNRDRLAPLRRHDRLALQDVTNLGAVVSPLEGRHLLAPHRPALDVEHVELHGRGIVFDGNPGHVMYRSRDAVNRC